MRRWSAVWAGAAALFLIFALLAWAGVVPVLEFGDKIASIASACASIGSLGISYAMWRQGGGAAVDPVAEALRQLAEAVDIQWGPEVGTRRIDDEESLPVRWTVHGPAGTSAGPIDTRSMWHEAQILTAYREVGHRRLVILGGVGSGKSALAVRLTRALAEEARSADVADAPRPVPVYLSLASWDPETRGLRTWLVRRLTDDYPFLRRRELGKDMPARLVQGRRLVFVLDGFDEIPPTLRASALREIDRANLHGLILTSRPDEYTEAQRAGGITVAGAAHAAIEPLTVHDLNRDFFARRLAEERKPLWDPVLERLHDHPRGRLARALRTPLMASLARDVYEDPARDPRELIRPNAFPTADAIERHLAQALIPAVFRPPPDVDGQRWDAERAARWLRFLARELPPEGQIRWWELSLLARTWDRMLSASFSAAVIGPAFFLGFRLLWGTWAGAAAGVLAGGAMAFATARTLPPPSALYLGRIRKLWAPLRGALVVGAVAVAVCSIREGLAFGVPVGLALGVPVGFVYAWAAPDATVRPVSPRRLLRQDIRVAAVFGFTYAFATGAVVGFAVHPLYGAAFGLFCGLSGAFFYGPVWLLAFRLRNVGVIAWTHFSFARLVLVGRRELPWRTLAFLEEAHARGALRQVGSVYEFRHEVVREVLTANP